MNKQVDAGRSTHRLPAPAARLLYMVGVLFLAACSGIAAQPQQTPATETAPAPLEPSAHVADHMETGPASTREDAVNSVAHAPAGAGAAVNRREYGQAIGAALGSALPARRKSATLIQTAFINETQNPLFIIADQGVRTEELAVAKAVVLALTDALNGIKLLDSLADTLQRTHAAGDVPSSLNVLLLGSNNVDDPYQAVIVMKTGPALAWRNHKASQSEFTSAVTTTVNRGGKLTTSDLQSALVDSSPKDTPGSTQVSDAVLDLRPGTNVTLALRGHERQRYTTPVGRFALSVETSESRRVTLIVGQQIFGAKAGDAIELVVERATETGTPRVAEVRHASLYGVTVDPPPDGVLDLGKDGVNATITISLKALPVK